MTGTLRTANRDLRAMMLRRIREVCAGVGQAMNCEIEAGLTEGYAPLVNDGAHCERVLATARRLFGAEKALIKEAPSMGAEDFSYFLGSRARRVLPHRLLGGRGASVRAAAQCRV